MSTKKRPRREITGKAKGALARAEALSPERRKEIAAMAAAARWGEKPIKSGHRGNFREEFGIDVDCYVLDDEKKTAVISKSGMGAALGLGEISTRLLAFVRGQKIAPHVARELAEKLENPIVFQWSPQHARTPPVIVHGYDVTILIDICKAVIAANAEKPLLPRQQHIVRQAQTIVGASAKAGIQNLVYALAGYDPTRAELIQAFKEFVRQEAKEYEKEFPPQLYEEWYRLYRLPKPKRNKPWKFMHLTVNQVYTPLAQSNGKILELTRAQKAKSEDRHAKLHQFLSEIGTKALRTHLGQLLGIAKLSDGKDDYERNVTKVFGEQPELDFTRKP